MNSVQPKQDGNDDEDDDDDDDCRVCVGHSLMVKGLSSVWLGSIISTRSNLITFVYYNSISTPQLT